MIITAMKLMHVIILSRSTLVEVVELISINIEISTAVMDENRNNEKPSEGIRILQEEKKTW
jgi:hypothetical protein